jgi:hypothetical protein
VRRKREREANESGANTSIKYHNHSTHTHNAMATYNPPAFPRRPKTSNILTETRYQLQLAYYRYEINTALYVMSPGEKLAYNLILLSLLLMFVTSVYYYFPRTVQLGLQRLGYYITGSHMKVDVSMHMKDVSGVGRVLVDNPASLMDLSGVVGGSGNGSGSAGLAAAP